MTISRFTRQELRREIARLMRMEFARRYPDVLACTASADTTHVTDTKLTQASDFWANSFLYMVDGPAAGDVRRITAFAAGAVTLEYATSAQVAAGNLYEIHSMFSASDIHAAINRALREGLPSFFDVVTDETLVLQKDTLAYALSTLATAPWMITKIWREVSGRVLRGTATAGAVGSLTDTALIGQISGVTGAWRISIFAGTGAGQWRIVNTANNGTGAIAPTVNWNPAPDTTSQYALWNPSVQYEDWPRVLAARFDQKEWPNTIYFQRAPAESWGLRLRLQTLTSPAALSTETASTPVPSEYLVEKAQAILFSSMVNDSRADRQRFGQQSNEHLQLAEAARIRHAFHPPDGTLWQESEGEVGYSSDPADPMGWRR